MIGQVKLHHVSFATKDLAASRAFFGDVLGLPEIQRPGFNFPGAWYALGDRQLHLIENPGDSAGPPARLSRSDHLALEVADLDAVRQSLNRHRIPYQEGGNRRLGMEQLFCSDPDGHVIEFVRYL
jgi:catechol 2,3-dioxygenase-like lactoylglutathione lyase family enzyme